MKRTRKGSKKKVLAISSLVALTAIAVMIPLKSNENTIPENTSASHIEQYNSQAQVETLEPEVIYI